MYEDADERPLAQRDHAVFSGDGDDQPLVQPAPRKEPAEESRDQLLMTETLRPPVAPMRRRNGQPVWQDPTATLEQEVSGDSRERAEDASILGRQTEGEALRNIINKLSEERNLRDLHLKHYHMSTAQFQKRTTHLDIAGFCFDLDQHVVKTRPFCNSVKPRPERSRVSGLWAEEFGDLTFLEGFLIVLDGATSHLTPYPCKSTSPSEVVAELHECMDTFKMNPMAICAGMAFHQPHDMQAFYRMHIVKRLPTGPPTPWSNRTEMGVRLFKKFLLALMDTASKNLDQTTLAQVTPAQLMRKAATVRNTQVTLSGETPIELGMGGRPRDLLDPASMTPEQLTSTPTKQDLLNEEIQKLAVRAHLQVQEREDIRRDLAERKVVLL